MVQLSGGGGGGSLFHWRLYHIPVNHPQKSTLNKDIRVHQKTPLKPRARDKHLYSTLTSSLMLMPVTHPTQCVAECAKCGFSGQANKTWGPSTEFSGPSPDSIWPSELHRSICTHNTLANHRTLNTHPHCHFDWCMGIGCAMAAERWVWANEKPYFFYVEISALRTEFARKQISLRMINKRQRLVPVP